MELCLEELNSDRDYPDKLRLGSEHEFEPEFLSLAGNTTFTGEK